MTATDQIFDILPGSWDIQVSSYILNKVGWPVKKHCLSEESLGRVWHFSRTKIAHLLNWLCKCLNTISILLCATPRIPSLCPQTKSQISLHNFFAFICGVCEANLSSLASKLWEELEVTSGQTDRWQPLTLVKLLWNEKSDSPLASVMEDNINFQKKQLVRGCENSKIGLLTRLHLKLKI